MKLADRRVIIAVVVTVVVIGGLIPWLSGIYAEKKIRSMIDLEESLQIISYQRGWLSSQATTQIQPNSLNSSIKPILITHIISLLFFKEKKKRVGSFSLSLHSCASRYYEPSVPRI